MSTPLTLFLTDDHLILLDGMRRMLSDEADFKLLGSANSAEHTLTMLTDNRPDVLVTDLSFGRGMTGIALIRQVRKTNPTTRVIMLTMNNDPVQIREAVQLGVDGYVLKTDDTQELVWAIRTVGYQKRAYFSASVVRALADSGQPPISEIREKELTDRELEILTLIAREVPTAKIATDLFISKDTVETHRRNLMRKVGVRSAVGLVNFAYRNGIS